MSAYADTSFIGSLYLLDSNSNLAASRTAEEESPILLSSLGELELVNALQLHVFRKEIRQSDLHAAVAWFRADVESGTLVVKPVSEAMYAEALRLSTEWSWRLGTRSLDILQVASAIVLGAETFHTFDDRQKKLAKAAGLVCR